jgi:hypothetical protein
MEKISQNNSRDKNGGTTLIMPAFTYMNTQDFRWTTSDDELNELIEELRRVSGEVWIVHEYEYCTGKLWWEKKYKSYYVYFCSNKYYSQYSTEEVQYIYCASGTKEVTKAYMLGQLTVYDKIKRNKISLDTSGCN